MSISTPELSPLPEEQARLWVQAASNKQATALAHPNIAFIKYWGNQDNTLRLPSNASLSMNLGSLYTVTNGRYDTQASYNNTSF